MQCSIKGAYDCVKAFSESDFTEDLKNINVPTLILDGDADQIVPIHGLRDAVHETREKLDAGDIPGAPHGMCTTHANKVNADLLAFLKDSSSNRAISGKDYGLTFHTT